MLFIRGYKCQKNIIITSDRKKKQIGTSRKKIYNLPLHIQTCPPEKYEHLSHEDTTSKLSENNRRN